MNIFLTIVAVNVKKCSSVTRKKKHKMKIDVVVDNQVSANENNFYKTCFRSNGFYLQKIFSAAIFNLRVG
jgi:hypothetical protein